MEDPKWGVLGRDGKWNGLMEAIVEKRFDMALTSLKVNAEREAAVDFTAPFLESGDGIRFNAPHNYHVLAVHFKLQVMSNGPLGYYLYRVLHCKVQPPQIYDTGGQKNRHHLADSISWYRVCTCMIAD